MADVRTRQYPLLPTPRRGAPRTRLALPEQGELHLRSLVPAAFVQQLAIHCQPEARHVYDRFLVKRRFIVMDRGGGDLFMQEADHPLRANVLPPMLALPPPLAPWDIVKVLDLVQCSQFGADGALVPNVRWELVRVRWRSGRDSWVPVELMASQPPVLLQEFYVNTINSWHFVDRVFPESLARFRTEVELWLHHPEFQPLYQLWRNRAARLLASNGDAQATTADVKDRRLVADAQRDFPLQTQQQQLLQVPSQLAQRIQPPPLAQSTQPPPATQRIPPPPPAKQPPSQPVHSNGSRIPPQPLARVAHLPPLPPTPPRPSQEQPPELRMAPPPLSLSLNGHRESIRPVPTNGVSSSTAAQHKQKSKEKDPRPESTPSKKKDKEKEKRRKEKRDKEKERETHRDKEHRKENRDKNNEREKEKSKHKGSSDKEKEKEKKRKKRKETTPSRHEHETPSKESASKRKERRRERSPETPRTADRRRKRLKWSQTASDEEESDDLPELTQRSRGENEGQTEKRFKRLRKVADGKKAEPEVIVIDADDDDENEGSVTVPLKMKKKKKKKKDKNEKQDKKEKKDKKRSRDGEDPTENDAEQPVEIETVPDATDIDGDAEDTADDESTTQQMFFGEIRCECGATKVGRYTGQWLQCCKEDCEVWQHAECVGLLIRRGEDERLPDKYRCSKCDPETFEKRYQKGKLNPRAWLSLCCESKNQHQLLKLLDEEEQRDAEVVSELAASRYGSSRLTLLMEAARNGLTHTVRRLMRRYKVNVHATDARSHNALYHAVRGESVSVADFLMKNAEALVRHQDLNGVMPLHLMLQSPVLNGLCPPLLAQNHALCVTSDFGGGMPIHFACQAVNESTVENVRQILSVQPMAALEKSSERLTPFLYLCRASGGALPAEIARKALSVQRVIDLFLDVDVLAEFFSDHDFHGWTGLHFAADVGNHALLAHLCELDEVDIDALTFDGGETALHLAARANRVECIRVLLENRRQRLDVVAVDGSKRIPTLRTTDAACLQQLLYYDLDRQLRFISNLARNYRHHELLRNWMRFVTSDPTNRAIVNDWLQYQIPLLDELDELFLLHRAFFRVDCKLDYVYQQVLPAIKLQSRRPQDSRVEITLSSQGECYWKQFVAQTKDFDAVVFRQKLRVAISRGENLRLDNLTLVLVRLLAGLLQPSTGLLVRNELDATLDPSPHRQADDAETIREYFVLGELVAYLVLNKVSVGEVFEFSTPFLTAVLGLRLPSHDEAAFSRRVFGESFAAGFEAVLPATLALFHVEELRVLLNARIHSLNVSGMDWDASVKWVGFPESGREVAVQWWMRMVDELVEEERVALVLWLTGSFCHAQRVFFETDTDQPRARIQRFQAPSSETTDGDSAALPVNEDDLLPVLDAAAGSLVLPVYSSFARFRTAVLGVFRHAEPTASLH